MANTVYSSAVPNAASNSCHQFDNAQANGVSGSAAGFTILRVDNGGTSDLLIGVSSGAANVQCYAEELQVSTTVTAGNVVVWGARSNRVNDAGGTSQLTTIAGVALTAGTTDQVVLVARSGRCFVAAVAGITTASLVGSSSSTAAAVTNAYTPSAGAVIGRACEGTSSTIANQVMIDLVLG